MNEVQTDLFKILAIARVCHEANRAWCIANGDMSQVDWEDAPEWQKQSTLESVRFRLENPDAPISAQHDQWMESKLKDGWVYGPIKHAGEKTHPCLVPFEDLLPFEKDKDALFAAIVNSLKDYA